MIKLKRAYEPASKSDGTRILVERLWPRGVTKDRAALDLWMKDIAPSPELRMWFAHDPARWPEFKKRYWAELRAKKDLVEEQRRKARSKTVTFVYAAKDEERNSAVLLKAYIERK